MVEKLIINGKQYTYHSNYKENTALRKSFNDLTEKIFGFNFKKWYEYGYWGDKYIPYSLLEGDTVVANISVNIMDFLILGEQKRYIQIGTVMTEEKYREKGLSRILMEKVLKEWDTKCDLIYLFANDSVLNFYPKFGFSKWDEYQYSISKIEKSKQKKVRKMIMDNDEEREFVYSIVHNALPLSKISMIDNVSLIMFYCIYFMKDNIYYIEDYNAIVVCDFNEDVLYLKDVFSTKDVKIESIINAIMRKETKKIVLGFTPEESFSYKKDLLNEEDTTLFIKSGKDNPFKIEDLMFPLLSHA